MAVSVKVPEMCTRCKKENKALATMTAPNVDRQTGLTTRALPRWLCPACGHQWEVDPDAAQHWLAGLFEGPRAVAPTTNMRRSGAR